MAAALPQPAYDSYGLRRKRFRREEVSLMLELGLFEGQRFDAKAEFEDRHPFGHELALAIEVADTSFRKDSTRKREIYAAAQVPEYSVLDLESRRLMICRDLRDGDYRDMRLLGEAETVAMLGVTVGQLLS